MNTTDYFDNTLLPQKHIRVTTTQLIELNEDAIANERNRAMDETKYDDLDPDGLHMVLLALWHEHKGFELTTPHVRCQFMLKTKDQTFEDIKARKVEPPTVFIDCDAARYMALDEAWTAAMQAED